MGSFAAGQLTGETVPSHSIQTIATLADVMANRRWVRRARPFPHVTASNVFDPTFYDMLDDEFRTLQRDQPELFVRSLSNYDAAACNIDVVRDGPLGVFLSREWHDMLQRLTGVAATGDVVATLHHHDAGSRRGWPHNDLNPGWFGGPPPGPRQVRTEASSTVNYRDGTSTNESPARAAVRAVSVLFYLANGPWKRGEQGETGLFTHATDTAPAIAVPPIDNSLVMFECTPYSMHAFLGTSKPRNCVVMWLHRPRTDAVSRWGEHSIVEW